MGLAGELCICQQSITVLDFRLSDLLAFDAHFCYNCRAYEFGIPKGHYSNTRHLPLIIEFIN